MNYKDFFSDLYEAYPWGGFDATTSDFDDTQKDTANTASDDPKDLAVRSTRISDILERNTPTSPENGQKLKQQLRQSSKCTHLRMPTCGQQRSIRVWVVDGRRESNDTIY